MRKLCLIVIMLFAPIFCLASETFQKIKENKTFKVCAESGYLPLEMKSVSGAWLGFDVDMMKAYAKNIGVNLVMLDTKWDGIIPSLVSGKCDAIASSMAITKERENAVAFSNPYYENKFLIAVKNTQKNLKRFENLSSFNNTNVTIAVKTGSSPDLFVQNSKMFEKAHILKYDADADTVGAVLNAKADAFIYDTPYVKLASLHYPGKLYIIPEGFNGDHFAVAFRKQDGDLRESFNKFLEQWKQQGQYASTMKYYFDGTTWTAMLDK